MQSVCSVLPGEEWQQVIDARALACEDPVLGAIYDPPFAHFTHQLAEEYDWDGLAGALAAFAKQHRPFEVRTTGLQVFSGGDTGPLVTVYRSKQLIEYHEALWQAISPYAIGTVPGFYEPEAWVPHVTIKRCGTHWERFGNLMAQIVQWNFARTFTIDNVSVQCDPGHNSRTHYQRLYYRLGDATPGSPIAPATNASIIEVTPPPDSDAAPVWRFAVQPDGGVAETVTMSSPELTQVMADARCSEVHFAGGRCRIEDGRIASVVPNAPFPVVGLALRRTLAGRIGPDAVDPSNWRACNFVHRAEIVVDS